MLGAGARGIAYTYSPNIIYVELIRAFQFNSSARYSNVVNFKLGFQFTIHKNKSVMESNSVCL